MLTKPRHNFENEGKSTFSMAATFKTSCIIITVEENKQTKKKKSLLMVCHMTAAQTLSRYAQMEKKAFNLVVIDVPLN